MIKAKKRQKGFTLIEIIAVLVILGILAAVAVPKFVNMQKEARKKAAQGLISAVQSGLSMKYSEELLKNNGDIEKAWDALNSTNCDDYVSKEDGFKDYNCTITKDGDTITIKVTHSDFDGEVKGTFTKPQS